MSQSTSLPCAQVYRDDKFGKPKFYPVNSAAETLATLINKKTFDQKDLELIRQLGFEIEILKR